MWLTWGTPPIGKGALLLLCVFLVVHGNEEKKTPLEILSAIAEEDLEWLNLDENIRTEDKLKARRALKNRPIVTCDPDAKCPVIYSPEMIVGAQNEEGKNLVAEETTKKIGDNLKDSVLDSACGSCSEVIYDPTTTYVHSGNVQKKRDDDPQILETLWPTTETTTGHAPSVTTKSEGKCQLKSMVEGFECKYCKEIYPQEQNTEQGKKKECPTFKRCLECQVLWPRTEMKSPDATPPNVECTVCDIIHFPLKPLGDGEEETVPQYRNCRMCKEADTDSARPMKFSECDDQINIWPPTTSDSGNDGSLPVKEKGEEESKEAGGKMASKSKSASDEITSTAGFSYEKTTSPEQLRTPKDIRQCVFTECSDCVVTWPKGTETEKVDKELKDEAKKSKVEVCPGFKKCRDCKHIWTGMEKKSQDAASQTDHWLICEPIYAAPSKPVGDEEEKTVSKDRNCRMYKEAEIDSARLMKFSECEDQINIWPTTTSDIGSVGSVPVKEKGKEESHKCNEVCGKIAFESTAEEIPSPPGFSNEETTAFRMPKEAQKNVRPCIFPECSDCIVTWPEVTETEKADKELDEENGHDSTLEKRGDGCEATRRDDVTTTEAPTADLKSVMKMKKSWRYLESSGEFVWCGVGKGHNDAEKRIDIPMEAEDTTEKIYTTPMASCKRESETTHSRGMKDVSEDTTTMPPEEKKESAKTTPTMDIGKAPTAYATTSTQTTCG